MLRLLTVLAVVLPLLMPRAVEALEPEQTGQESPREYREVSLLDGTIVRGVVQSVTAESLVLLTPSGERALPLMEVMQIEPISREELLKKEGLLVLYLPLEAPSSMQARAKSLDALLVPSLEREMLLIIPVSALTPEQRNQLAACEDLACRLLVARALGMSTIAGSLEVRDGRDYLTLLRFSRYGEQVAQASRVLATQGKESEAMGSLSRTLYGEAAPVEPVAAPEPPALPTKVHSEKELQARRLDLLPLPGVSSVTVYHDRTPALVSAAAVVVVTGAGVYLVGSMPLSVPWTYEERGLRDAALLSSVGAVTYLATTWLSNSIIRHYHVRREARAATLRIKAHE